jgi:adenine-specific DNA-methyltransferase
VIEIIVVIKTVVACVIRWVNKKVITSAKKYTQNGVSDKVNFNRNENGLIKDNLIIKGNNLLALHTLKF